MGVPPSFPSITLLSLCLMPDQWKCIRQILRQLKGFLRGGLGATSHSSLPQIPQAGGKAGCMARRASSQETTWRRSEWEPRILSSHLLGSQALPAGVLFLLAALARRSSLVASSLPQSGSHLQPPLSLGLSHVTPPSFCFTQG